MADDRRNSDRAGALHLLERMLFLSDAVFAIVLTLLVLDLHVPADVSDANLFRAILAMEPRLVAFAITFALVSIFWIAHVAALRRLQVFDWPVAWVNLTFLFTITLTPFASTLLGAYSVFGNAWRFYCLVLIAIGVAQAVLMLVIYRDHAHLVGGASRREFWYRFSRAISPCAAFAVCLALSLLGLRQASVYLSFALVPLALVLARLLIAARAPAAAKPGSDIAAGG
jgi:uncharacterized membrane protein